MNPANLAASLFVAVCVASCLVPTGAAGDSTADAGTTNYQADSGRPDGGPTSADAGGQYRYPPAPYGMYTGAILADVSLSGYLNDSATWGEVRLALL